MKIHKNKKGFGKALNFLLALILIVLNFALFFKAYAAYLDPVTKSVVEIPKEIDDNLLLINLLKTKANQGTVADVLKVSYLSDDYSDLEHIITKFVDDYYGEEHYWEIYINEYEKASNFLTMVTKTKVYGSSIIIPSYSKEAIEFELFIYKE